MIGVEPTWRGVPVTGRCAAGAALGKIRIKTCVEDFQVDEILGFEPEGSGEHVYLRVRKTGLNTAWLAGEIARTLRLKARHVSWSGRKDRHAVTTQWFSCWLPGVDPDLAPIGDLAGVDLLAAVRHPRKLRIGDHAGNRFRLHIRGDGAEHPEALCRACALRAGFPNYFGPQRFGANAGNLERAVAFFALQDRRRARRKTRTRDIFYSAARAFLFNRLLDAAVAQDAWRSGTGLLPGDAALSPNAAELLGPFSDLVDGLATARLAPAQRAFCTRPARFGAEQGDLGLGLTFELPQGAYATAFLRELGQVVDVSEHSTAAPSVETAS